MKKIFAGILLGTMLVAGQSLVFANQGTPNQVEEGIMMATTEAIHMDDLSEEEKAKFEAEMKEAEKNFDKQLESVAKELGCSKEALKEKLEKGELNEAEQAALSKIGVMAVATASDVADSVALAQAIKMEDLSPEEQAKMEAEMKKAEQAFNEAFEGVAKKLGYSKAVLEEKLQKDELTKEEKKELEKVGVLFASGEGEGSWSVTIDGEKGQVMTAAMTVGSAFTKAA